MIIFMVFFLLSPREICQNLKSFQHLIPYFEKIEGEKIFYKIIDEGIYELRGPKEDGTFLYAYLSEENPQSLHFSLALEKYLFIWRQKGDNIFSIKIKIQNKKNIFWGNEDAYLQELSIKFGNEENLVDGRKILKRGNEYEKY